MSSFLAHSKNTQNSFTDDDIFDDILNEKDSIRKPRLKFSIRKAYQITKVGLPCYKNCWNTLLFEDLLCPCRSLFTHAWKIYSFL